MGISTDATLAYGIDIGEDLFYDHPDSEEGRLYQYEALEHIEPILKKYNIAIDRHCSAEYPMFFIYYEETLHKAWRGSPNYLLDFKKMMQKEKKANAAFKELFANCELEVIQKINDTTPRWCLYSDWG